MNNDENDPDNGKLTETSILSSMSQDWSVFTAVIDSGSIIDNSVENCSLQLVGLFPQTQV